MDVGKKRTFRRHFRFQAEKQDDNDPQDNFGRVAQCPEIPNFHIKRLLMTANVTWPQQQQMCSGEKTHSPPDLRLRALPVSQKSQMSSHPSATDSWQIIFKEEGRLFMNTSGAIEIICLASNKDNRSGKRIQKKTKTAHLLLTARVTAKSHP